MAKSIKRKCVACGQIFYTWPCRVKKGYGNYCSRSCVIKVNAPKYSKNPLLRLKEKIIIDKHGCWLWQGKLTSAGYAVFIVLGKRYYVHRWTYEYFRGPLTPGLEIDHLCRVRHCVNPRHLELVTHKENILRGEAPHVILSKNNVCKKGHILDENNTYRRKKTGYRSCRTCHRIKERIRRRAIERNESN